MSRALRVGLFVVATLAIFAGGVFLIGSREFLFQSTYRLKAEFPNVAGLEDGAEVRVGGIHKGTIRRIDLPQRPDQKVRVVMDMDKDTRGVVKKDSVASIETEGLVGDSYVEVSFGSDGAGQVEDGDTIAGQPPLKIGDLMKKTDQILESSFTATEPRSIQRWAIPRGQSSIAKRWTFPPIRATIFVDDRDAPPRAGEIHDSVRSKDPGICSEGGIGSGAGGG
jgi:hypothetical protein